MERVLIPNFILVVLYLIIVEFGCYGHARMDDYILSEREALVDFKSGIKDLNNRLSSWEGANYCSWLGITCENITKFVISVDLHNQYARENIDRNWNTMNLRGEIRPSLGELKHLKYLDLSFNSFQPLPIPQFFGSLHNLLYLNLSSAGFSGKVPSNLGNLSNLQHLDLSNGEYLYVEDIEWLTSLLSLESLSLDSVDLVLVGSQWAKVLNRLPNLTELHLSRCIIIGFFPFGLGELPNLQYLDLSQNLVLGNISQVLSKSWRKLESLNLKETGLYGSIPSTIGNLCNLKYLDLSYNNINGSLPASIEGHENCGGKSGLPNLMELSLGCNQLIGKLPGWLGEVRNLRVLNLSYNRLEGLIPDSLWTLQHLEYLDLGANGLNGPIPSAIRKFCNLKYLDLSDNNFNGSLPAFIEGHETCSGKTGLLNLMELHLGWNQLVGKLPYWLGEVRNLIALDLSVNQLEGLIPDSLSALQHLEDLNLERNELNGGLPKSIGQLSQLKALDVSSNHFSGSLSEEHFWNLSKLEYLSMGGNSFHLNVSPNWIPPFQVHHLYMESFHLGPSFPTWLQSQNNLQYLHLSNASISSPIPNWFWNVSFYLEELDLSQNQIRGQLPNSLNFSYAQFIDFSFNLLEGPIPFLIKGVHFLYLSHNKFSGPLPSNMGESMLNLSSLDLSNNQLTGSIPNSIGLLTSLYIIDLSKNNLTGTIPDSIGLLTSLMIIQLSRNNLTGSIPDSIGLLTSLMIIQLSRNNLTGSIPDSIGYLTSLQAIDFSMNNLTGSIPSILNNCSYLYVIDLGNNNFDGEIPKSLGSLQRLQSLHLNHNKLSGQLPSSFQNLSSLQVLDVSYNKLSREVPTWIGYAFPNLVILKLRSNTFSGRLPSQISNLSFLHVLDIAQNNLMGEIPITLGELKAMARDNLSIYELHEDTSTSYYEERLVVMTKGQSLEYTRTLSLVVVIDLSDNNLSGKFPEGITKLSGLIVLNLSRNLIIGEMSESISMLHQLSSLDLSSNGLSGIIPSSMVALTFLSYLNLSQNKFHGEIPFSGQMTTFNDLAFMGNPDLCGPPLAKKCRDETSSRGRHNVDNKKDDSYVDQWFYLSLGLGFAAGILVPYFILVIRKSWCETYFDFVDEIVKLLLRGRTIYTKNHPRRRE